MEERIKKIQDRLVKKKVKDFEIYIERATGQTLEVKNQEVDALEVDDSIGYGLRILNDHRLGFAYGTDFALGAVDDVIDRALATVPHSTHDLNYGWAREEADYPSVAIDDGSLYHIKQNEKIELVRQMEVASFDHDPRIKRVRYASYHDVFEEISFMNTMGLKLSYQKTTIHLSQMAIAESGRESESAFDSQTAAFWDDLNPSTLGTEVAALAVNLLGGKRIPNIKCPILLTPMVGEEILEVLAPSTFYDHIHKKNSWLIGKMGEKIYGDQVNLMDDGLLAKGCGSSPFDAEGHPRQTTAVIQGGVLKSYLYDTYWANRAGRQSTGNADREGPHAQPIVGISNFYLRPGSQSQKELLKQLDKGVLITEVIGMHTADLISGDFSVGIQGFWVEGGEVKYPIRSVVLTGNLHELFALVTAVGSDLKFYGNTGSPSILVAEGHIGGE